MKTTKELLLRAQLQLALADRLALETKFRNRPPKDHARLRQEHKVLCHQILNSPQPESLYDLMDDKDRTLMLSDPGTLDQAVRSSRTHEFDAVYMLMWACGLCKLTPIEPVANASVYLIAKIRPSLEELLEKAVLRPESDVITQHEVYRLWCWRCYSPVKYGAGKAPAVTEEVERYFGPQARMLADDHIRMDRGDFVPVDKPFGRLPDPMKESIRQRIKWRYYALEWILNDRSWYDTGIGA